jgi:hypothetical protein
MGSVVLVWWGSASDHETFSVRMRWLGYFIIVLVCVITLVSVMVAFVSHLLYFETTLRLLNHCFVIIAHTRFTLSARTPLKLETSHPDPTTL